MNIPECGGGGSACSALQNGACHEIRTASMCMVRTNQFNGILVFLQVWWFLKTGIEALIQCLVLVLENPFDVMPCINPLSIVRYTMGDKSLSDHLFRLRPVKYTLYPNV